MASCNTPAWPRQPGSRGSVVADVTAVLHLSCVWNSPRCPEKPLHQLRQGLPVEIASGLQGPLSPNPASWNLSAPSTWGRKWHHRGRRNTAGALATLKRHSPCLCCGGTVNIPLPGLCTVSCSGRAFAVKLVLFWLYRDENNEFVNFFSALDQDPDVDVDPVSKLCDFLWKLGWIWMRQDHILLISTHPPDGVETLSSLFTRYRLRPSLRKSLVHLFLTIDG